MATRKRKIGLVGYGELGKYLAHSILTDAKAKNTLEIGWIWNRSKSKIEQDEFIPKHLILENIQALKERPVDTIIEVCHPNIVAEYGELFLQNADFIVGSPTSFAGELRASINNNNFEN